MSSATSVVDQTAVTVEANVYEKEVQALRAIVSKWSASVNEVEELSVLKQFADQLIVVNEMVKTIPESMRSSASSSAPKAIEESKTEVAKWAKLANDIRVEFEAVVKAKWQGRIKYPIDWSEPDAWYALITLAMTHLGPETRLAWDRIVDSTKRLDSLVEDVATIMDTFLSFFGIKKSSSLSLRDDDAKKVDEARLKEKTGDDDISTALEKAINSLKNDSLVTMPSMQLNAAGVSREKVRRRKWIMILFFFVLISVIVIAYFSQKFGGY